MTVEIDHNALRSGLDKKARAREGDGRREKAREESSGGRGGFLRSLRRFFGGYIFSSLTHRILFLNLAALGVLMSGILYINQFRDGLIDARVESLMIQGEIIAGAIAASANVETNAILIDPDKLQSVMIGGRTDSEFIRIEQGNVNFSAIRF